MQTGGHQATRRILLVDADAFFVAVARLEDPGGAGKADLLIVGGAPGSRGVVCSASYAARAHGVRSAMSIAQALRLCPKAMCVPVPRGSCGRKSREIARVLGRFAPLVETASIDEWYLDMTGTETLYRGEPLDATAHRIRDGVQRETGLAVSIGGGTNRLIAKLAVEHAKPKPGTGANGVRIVAAGEEVAFMSRVALAEIPGIGPRFHERLARLGFVHAADVMATTEAEIVRRFGEREGRWLHQRARGVASAEVRERDLQKSVSHEETFDRDIDVDDELERELLRLVTRVASDLRAKDLAAATVSIKLRDRDFRTRHASRTLDQPVIADRVILSTARALLRKLRAARRVPARLLGVTLSSLSRSDEPLQIQLFDPAARDGETTRDRTIAATLDRVRDRFGPQALVPGRLARTRAASTVEEAEAAPRQRVGSTNSRPAPRKR
ncbi:MAG: DNA polymerase IV [Gemmatimonadaceae bacterium]|nr:DNA polymerase IV [Gemmatimonadaceae bacterium]